MKSAGIKPRIGEFDYPGYLGSCQAAVVVLLSSSLKAPIIPLRMQWAERQFGCTRKHG